MISICTPIYPWTGQHDRLCDLFEALLPSMEKMDKPELLQFSLVDNGTRDIYGMGRKHGSEVFRKKVAKICNKAGIDFKYQLEDNFNDENVWHLSKTLDDSIKQSYGELLFIAGADLILPKNFVQLMHDNVKDGEVWIPHCFNLMRGQEWREQYSHPLNGWRTARGILGITRSDYYKLGGYPVHRVGFRVGIDAALLRKCERNLHLNEFKCNNLFHLHHVGSKAVLPGKIEQRAS